MAREVIGRLLLTASFLWSWIEGIRYISSEAGLRRPHGLSAWIDLSVLTKPAALTALTVVFAGACLAFVLRRRQGAAGMVIFAVLALGSHLEAAQWSASMPLRHGSFLPGGALAAYLAAYGLARRRPLREREAFGWEAACGVVGAAYSLSALCKLRGSGLAAWLSRENLGLLIAERGYDASGWTRTLMLGFADSAPLCVAGAAAALLTELAGFLFVFRSARKPYALAASGMHLGIYWFMGYSYNEWIAVIMALAFLV